MKTVDIRFSCDTINSKMNLEETKSASVAKRSIADQYDVDAIIDSIGYSRFNLIPFVFVLCNLALTVSNILITYYSVWIPPDYIETVCNGTEVRMNLR